MITSLQTLTLEPFFAIKQTKRIITLLHKVCDIH